MGPLESYLHEMYDTYRSASGVPESSYYAALRNLLDAVGKALEPLPWKPSCPLPWSSDRWALSIRKSSI